MEQYNAKFIAAVQSVPCIWDIRLKSYFNRYSKKTAWEEVCLKMHGNFRNFSDDEKQATVKEFKKKWKCLKDFYYRRDPNEDMDKKTNRKKPLIELLEFLDTVKKTDRPMQANEISPAATIKLSIVVPEQKSTAKVPEKANNSETNSKYDSNIYFLQSVLPEMLSLDDRQRIEFKLGVIKLLNKIKYDSQAEQDHNTSNNTVPTQNIVYNSLLAQGSL